MGEQFFEKLLVGAATFAEVKAEPCGAAVCEETLYKATIDISGRRVERGKSLDEASAAPAAQVELAVLCDAIFPGAVQADAFGAASRDETLYEVMIDISGRRVERGESLDEVSAAPAAKEEGDGLCKAESFPSAFGCIGLGEQFEKLVAGAATFSEVGLDGVVFPGVLDDVAV